MLLILSLYVLLFLFRGLFFPNFITCPKFTFSWINSAPLVTLFNWTLRSVYFYSFLSLNILYSSHLAFLIIRLMILILVKCYQQRVGGSNIFEITLSMADKNLALITCTIINDLFKRIKTHCNHPHDIWPIFVHISCTEYGIQIRVVWEWTTVI